MKSRALFILCVLLFSYAIPAQFHDFPTGFSAIPQSKLNGPVRTVLLVEKNGEATIGGQVTTFDQNGRIIDFLSSNTYSVWDGDYHSTGVTERTIQSSEKRIYLYDKRGGLIRMNRFINDEYFDYEIYELDGQKRRVSSKRFYPDGKPAEVFTMKYSDKPCEVRVSWQMYRDGKFDRPNGAVLKCDEQGRWTSRQMDIGDEPVTFEYDQHGNLVKVLHCCKYNYWYMYENKLDKYKNWTEREIVYFQKNADGTVTRRPETQKEFRVITYFRDAIENSK